MEENEYLIAYQELIKRYKSRGANQVTMIILSGIIEEYIGIIESKGSKSR